MLKTSKKVFFRASTVAGVIFLITVGLPLRPLVLFSGMGDLLELYWSGAGQEKTTLLQVYKHQTKQFDCNLFVIIKMDVCILCIFNWFKV